MHDITLPPRLEEIVADFSELEGREKLELLLEYAERFPSLSEQSNSDRQAIEPIPECMTPVFLKAELVDGGLEFAFDIPPESPTVRGYASIFAEGLHHLTPEQVLVIPNDFYLRMGLEKVLSSQRLNGMAAILAHIKAQAVRFMAQDSA